MSGLGRSFGAALIVCANAGAAHGETLADAIDAARAGPRPSIARAEYLASTAQTSLARAYGRPTVSVDAQATRDFDSDIYGPRLREDATVSLSVPLYSGGRIRESVAAARAAEQGQRAGLDAEDLRLVVAVADVYTAMLEARALRRIATEHLGRLSDYAVRIEAERKAGIADATDVADGQSRLMAGRRDALDAERREAAAAERYRELVGHLPGDLVVPVTPDLPFDQAGATDAVLRDNPELRSLRAAITAAAHEVSAERGLGRPSLSFVGSGSYGNTGFGITNTNEFALSPDGALEQLGSPRLFPRRFTARARLVLTIPLYQGGEGVARVARAEAARRDADAHEQSREREIVAQARTAVIQARGALVRERLSEAAIDAGRDALKGVDIGRSVGDRSDLDVLNQSRELATAQSQHAHASREAIMQAIVALAATGRLPENLKTGTRAGAVREAQSDIRPSTFDLAALPGSRHEPTGIAAATRPLHYDLTGLG